MNINEVIALANAGFNKEEIAKIAAMPQPVQQVQQVQQVQPLPQVQQVQQVQPLPQLQQVQQVQQKPEDKLFESIFGKLDDIQKSVYQQNINNVEQKIETVDDILANILDPKEDKKG